MRPRLNHTTLLLLVTALALVAIILTGCGGGDRTSSSGTTPAGSTTSPGTAPTTPSGGTQPTAPQTGPATTPSGNETTDVEAASAAAVADAKATSPGLGDLRVLAVEVVGDWARVDMQPADGSADKASWLLRKVDGSWQVVDRGTTLLPADHPDAPPSVFQ